MFPIFPPLNCAFYPCPFIFSFFYLQSLLSYPNTLTKMASFPCHPSSFPQVNSPVTVNWQQHMWPSYPHPHPSIVSFPVSTPIVWQCLPTWLIYPSCLILNHASLCSIPQPRPYPFPSLQGATITVPACCAKAVDVRECGTWVTLYQPG